MKSTKHLPTKPTLIVPKNKKIHIRNQHYNPFKPKNKKYIKKFDKEIVNIDKGLHNELKKKLKELGVLDNAYYVGGMVRDSFMGKPAKDVDIVIEKPTKEMIENLEKNLEKTGKDFPVYRLKIGDEEIEIALARTEKKVDEGYKGFEVKTGEDIDIVKDLYRRDITINAMAVPVNDLKTLVDPFDGLKDLKKGIIKHVSEAFAEDPLRVLRVARFAARYGFNVDKSTLKLMEKLKNELKSISPERVFEEINKMYKQSKNPSVFFDILRKSNTLDVWFPEISKMIGIEQPKEHHPEGDVYNHTMETIDNIRKFGGSVEEFWGALFHDIGKIDTPKEILPKHIEHEKRGLKYVNILKKRYRLSNRIKDVIKDSIEFHMKVPKIDEMKPSKVIDLVERLIKNKTLDEVINVASADRLRTGGLSNDVFENINIAKEVINEKLPQDIVDKIREAQKNKQYEKIKQLILQHRIKRFKELKKAGR